MPIKVIRLEEHHGAAKAVPSFSYNKDRPSSTPNLLLVSEDKHLGHANVLQGATEVPTSTELKVEVDEIYAAIETLKNHCTNEVSNSLKEIQKNVLCLKNQILSDINFKMTLKKEIIKELKREFTLVNNELDD